MGKRQNIGNTGVRTVKTKSEIKLHSFNKLIQQEKQHK